MWLFHGLINTEENQWIRKESAFRLVTLFNVQRGRISEEPTAPNTIYSLINAKGLIEQAHKTDPKEIGAFLKSRIKERSKNLFASRKQKPKREN